MSESAAIEAQLDITKNVNHRAIREKLSKRISSGRLPEVSKLLSSLPKAGDVLHIISLPNFSCLAQLSNDICNEQMNNWLKSKDSCSVEEAHERQQKYEVAAQINYLIAKAAGGAEPKDLIY